MTKRKRVDELRWAVRFPSGNVLVYGRSDTRQYVYSDREDDEEEIIRVRVTEVVKRRKKR